jgi:hypothetical protein
MKMRTPVRKMRQRFRRRRRPKGEGRLARINLSGRAKKLAFMLGAWRILHWSAVRKIGLFVEKLPGNASDS